MKLNSPYRNIDPVAMHEATDVLASLGISVSDAFSLMINSIARNKRLPHEMVEPYSVPNAETRDAMEDVRSRRNLTRAKDANELFDQLGI